MVILFSLVIFCLTCGNVATETFTVGGLFHDDNYQAEMAFKYAIKKHNMFNQDIKFKPKIVRISKTDGFAVSKTVCDMISSDEGVVALFGPESPTVSSMVQSIAANLEIPHLQTNYKPKSKFVSETVLNFYPDPELLAYGLATVVRELDWKTYIILYELPDSLIRLQEILKISVSSASPVIVRQLSDGDDYRPLLKELKSTKEPNIILDCRVDHILEILSQAKEVGLLDYFYNYVLIPPDSSTLDYTELQSTANITTIRFADPESPVFHNVVRDWEMGELHSNRQITVSTHDVLAEAILMHDAVNFFTQAFRELHITEPIVPKALSCDASEKWEHGFRLATYMKVRPMLNALTGTIKFNEWGKREDFTLEAVEIITGKVEKTAFWTPSHPDHLNYTRTETEQMQQIVSNLQKITVIVSSRLGPPYLMARAPRYEGEILEGNARYEGYSLDLIDAISKEVNFTYRFELTEDGKYGSYDEEKKAWNGLIKDLLERKAHLAICDLTINHQRREVVDFSLPFMTLGVSILYRKPLPSETNIFSFMDPLDATVWLYIVSAYISLTLIVLIIARMAPGDWENPHPCDRNPKELENIWDLKNCSWLILGSMMSAGCDILPKGISTRMATSMWWFLILIINSSYTANLAAFLTMENSAPTIDSAESLAKQTKIKYGTVDGGSTQNFFRESNFSTYARMWTQMESSKPSVFEKNNDDGVKRVLTTKNQQYAFLMESSSLEYEVEKNCDLKAVGGRMDSKGYGIAMPVNSPYRGAINKAVLNLQEAGTLNVLKTRWWKEKHGGGGCEKVESSGQDLKLSKIIGVFLVLGIGIAIAFLISLGEFLWNVHTVAVEQRIAHWEALKTEAKFAVKVWITEKEMNVSDSSSNKDEEESVPKKVSLEYNSLDNFDENGKQPKI